MAKKKSSTTFFFLLVSVSSSYRLSQEERINALELRVEVLETAMDGFEPMLAARYNLNRTCITPEVVNGEAMCQYVTCKKKGICAKKLKLGSKCLAVCNPGFIATPGKDVTLCKEDGSWTIELQCEIPLVLIGGSGKDSSTELLSLYPSQGCDVKIPDLPLDGGAHRRLHNLLYISPEKVLACNGLSKSPEATCDIWSISSNTWKPHTKPNKGSAENERECEYGGFSRYFDPEEECGPDRKKGRYASQIQTVEGETLIVGGMVFNDEGHAPTNTVRILTTDYLSSHNKDDPCWDKSDSMESSRAFFCSVKVKEEGMLLIGGLGNNAGGNTIEKSVEYRKMGKSKHYRKNKYALHDDKNWKPRSSFADMISPRSGHACSALPFNDYEILVTGGTSAFNTPATAEGEIFNWNLNSWRKAASMKTPRFGHALVTVGPKVFAIGGDDRNPENILDTIEEYDLKTNTWSIHETRLNRPRSDFGYTLVPHSMFPGCVVSDSLSE